MSGTNTRTPVAPEESGRRLDALRAVLGEALKPLPSNKHDDAMRSLISLAQDVTRWEVAEEVRRRDKDDPSISQAVDVKNAAIATLANKLTELGIFNKLHCGEEQRPDNNRMVKALTALTRTMPYSSPEEFKTQLEEVKAAFGDATKMGVLSGKTAAGVAVDPSAMPTSGTCIPGKIPPRPVPEINLFR